MTACFWVKVPFCIFISLPQAKSITSLFERVNVHNQTTTSSLPAAHIPPYKPSAGRMLHGLGAAHLNHTVESCLFKCCFFFLTLWRNRFRKKKKVFRSWKRLINMCFSSPQKVQSKTWLRIFSFKANKSVDILVGLQLPVTSWIFPCSLQNGFASKRETPVSHT